MTLFPAIIVFAVVFLAFSKEILGNKEEVPRRRLKADGSEPNMSDVMLRYKLMNDLKDDSSRYQTTRN
jgi:hypothetical protein